MSVKGYYSIRIGEATDVLDYILMGVSLLVSLYSLIFQIPSINISYIKATSIQMMKKKKFITQVVEIQ
jgi:hypothetical protein